MISAVGLITPNTLLLSSIKVVSQGEIVAKSLEDYLLRHSEIEVKCSKSGQLKFYTTDSTDDFDRHSQIFFGKKVNSVHAAL